MQEFYAKSAPSKLYGRPPYVREHLAAVAEAAGQFAAPLGLTEETSVRRL